MSTQAVPWFQIYLMSAFFLKIYNKSHSMNYHNRGPVKIRFAISKLNKFTRKRRTKFRLCGYYSNLHKIFGFNIVQKLMKNQRERSCPHTRNCHRFSTEAAKIASLNLLPSNLNLLFIYYNQKNNRASPG